MKTINTPSKPINGAIVNSNILEGDLKAIQFMYDTNNITNTESDNTIPLTLNDVCKHTSKSYNRGIIVKTIHVKK